jgi:hypothetical protein
MQRASEALPAKHREHFCRLWKTVGPAAALQFASRHIAAGSAPKKAAKKKGKSAGRMLQGCVMSDALCTYMCSLADPFTARPVGSPAYPLIPSEKFVAFCRGTILTSSDGGVGWILVNPYAGVANDQTGTDFPVYYVYGGTNTLTLTSTAGATVVAKNTNSPFTTSQIGDGPDKLRHRLVAAGVRVMPTSTGNAEGGYMVAWRDGINQSLVGDDIDDALANSACKVLPYKNNQWTSLSWGPATFEDSQYQEDFTNAFPSMVIWISSATVLQNLRYEFYGHYEVVGSSARGTTQTKSDAPGATAASEAMASNSQQGYNYRDGATSPLGSVLREAVGRTITQASHAAMAGVAHAAAGAARRVVLPYSQQRWRELEELR